MSTPLLDLGQRRIGEGEPCFVIAEAGVNHNGNPDLAKALIRGAREAGADAVKFQTWVTEKLITPDAPMAEYQKGASGACDEYSMLKALELSYGQFRELKAFADAERILFLSTPDEEDSADFLDGLGVPLFKIGSGEVTNLPYLRHVGCKHRPVILSTGMADLGEVAAAVEAVRSVANPDVALLHCVTAYPAAPADCNLRAMDTLRGAFACPVGFSDHTLGLEVAWAAAARGACIIEKHFTLDRNLPGPDHQASLTVAELGQMVRGIRRIESALGSGVKEAVPAEAENRTIVRKTLVASRSLPVGYRLTATDVLVRRGLGGLPPGHLPDLAGRVLRRDLRCHEPITLEALA